MRGPPPKEARGEPGEESTLAHGQEEALAHGVCEAAVGLRRASIAHEANLEAKGGQHKDTRWTRGKVKDTRRRLERATDEYEAYHLKKYERENAEHYRKLAAEARG